MFRQLMRDLVAPELKMMGFRGGYTRSFWIEHGEYVGSLWTQKNRHSTKTEVDFWVHLHASHAPTDRVYWEKELHWLDPGATAAGWTVEVGRRLEEAADSLLESIRTYGLPALQAAMDSPGYPPDPHAAWPRTFPPPGDDVADGPPDLGEIAWILTPLGQQADRWLPMLASENADERIEALHKISSLEEADPRCRTALLELRRKDPSRRVRRYVADLFKLPLTEDEDDRPPALDKVAWALRPTGQPADRWFANLSRERDSARMDAVRNMTSDAADDPRTLAVLLDRLEHDPSPRLRSYATELLTARTQTQAIQQALHDAASQDEDINVRWAARYALRLTSAEGG